MPGSFALKGVGDPSVRLRGPRWSDVGLFFDYRDPKFCLIELVRVKNCIGEILGVEADVMTRDSLHPRLKEWIEASAVRVF